MSLPSLGKTAQDRQGRHSRKGSHLDGLFRSDQPDEKTHERELVTTDLHTRAVGQHRVGLCRQVFKKPVGRGRVVEDVLLKLAADAK